MLKRKLTAAVLALALACSILPGMAVFAEDAPGGAGAIVVQEAPVQETPAAGTPAQPDAPVVSVPAEGAPESTPSEGGTPEGDVQESGGQPGETVITESAPVEAMLPAEAQLAAPGEESIEAMPEIEPMADEAEVSWSITGSDTTVTTGKGTLADAVSAINKDTDVSIATITLLRDIEITQSLEIQHNTVLTGAYTLMRGQGYEGSFFVIKNSLQLTGGAKLDGGAQVSGSGAGNRTYSGKTASSALLVVQGDGATLTVDNATLQNNNNTSGNGGAILL